MGGVSTLKAGKSSLGRVGGGNSAVINQIKLHTVARGPLRVAIVDEGKMRAAKNHLIYPEVRGQVKIIWLATEGGTIKRASR